MIISPVVYCGDVYLQQPKYTSMRLVFSFQQGERLPALMLSHGPNTLKHSRSSLHRNHKASPLAWFADDEEEISENEAPKVKKKKKAKKSRENKGSKRRSRREVKEQIHPETQ